MSEEGHGWHGSDGNSQTPEERQVYIHAVSVVSGVVGHACWALGATLPTLATLGTPATLPTLPTPATHATLATLPPPLSQAEGTVVPFATCVMGQFSVNINQVVGEQSRTSQRSAAMHVNDMGRALQR